MHDPWVSVDLKRLRFRRVDGKMRAVMTCPKCKGGGKIHNTLKLPLFKKDGTVEIIPKPSTWTYCDCVKGQQAKVAEETTG